ncbi:MAG: dienelactone hydrolase family protein [Solirubrobacterales bacterium]
MAGSNVEFASNGGTAQGYLATPESGNGPAVIVVQEWWGLQPEIKSVCDRYAAEGFFALAPDMFHGETTDQPSEGEQKLMALNVERAEKDLRGAVDFVAEQAGVDEVGSTGYCIGGALCLYAAALNPKVAATSSFYYVFPHAKPDFAKIEGPVLMHFGTNDDFIPTDAAEELVDEIAQAGVDVHAEFYEGMGHAFCNTANRLGTYDEAACELAWSRTLEFFRKNLS